jgi:Mg/Co/Ni transporter MgtE
MHDKLSITSPEQLRAALDTNDTAAIATYLSKTETRDLLHAITTLSEEDQSRLLLSLSDEAAAKLVDRMHNIQAAQMLERLSTDRQRRSSPSCRATSGPTLSGG